MDFDSDGLKTILFTFLFHFYSIIYAIRARSARNNFFNPFLRGFFFYFSTKGYTLFGMGLGSTSHVIFPCAYVVFILQQSCRCWFSLVFTSARSFWKHISPLPNTLWHSQRITPRWIRELWFVCSNMYLKIDMSSVVKLKKTFVVII